MFKQLTTAGACMVGALALITPLGAQKKEAPPQVRATLRIAWWRPPASVPELALLQEKEPVQFSPDTMGLTVKTSYAGPFTAVIARKTIGVEKDKQGNPIVSWTPYASVKIPSEGADLGVIMFPDNAGSSAQTQVFDFSESAFPYGSIQFVNYTNARVDAVVGDKVLQVPPRGRSQFPGSFTKRQPARFSLAVTEPGADPRLITSTTMIFFPNSRLMYFVLEMPGAKPEERYHNAVIMENKVVAPIPAAAPKAPPPTGKAPEGKAKAKAAAGGAN